MTGNALRMIKYYLIDRKKECQLGDAITSESRVTCGIPQGSILDLPLFLLCINYLHVVLDKLIFGYLLMIRILLQRAGETKEAVEMAINNDLLRIKEWLLAKS